MDENSGQYLPHWTVKNSSISQIHLWLSLKASQTPKHYIVGYLIRHSHTFCEGQRTAILFLPVFQEKKLKFGKVMWLAQGHKLASRHAGAPTAVFWLHSPGFLPANLCDKTSHTLLWVRWGSGGGNRSWQQTQGPRESLFGRAGQNAGRPRGGPEEGDAAPCSSTWLRGQVLPLLSHRTLRGQERAAPWMNS